MSKIKKSVNVFEMLEKRGMWKGGGNRMEVRRMGNAAREQETGLTTDNMKHTCTSELFALYELDFTDLTEVYMWGVVCEVGKVQ